MNTLLYLAPLAGIVALVFAFVLINRISSMDAGTDRMKEISSAITSGAMAFLKRQYRTLIIFVLIIVCAICLIGLVNKGDGGMNPWTALAFAIGAACSILAGNIGMRVATKANVRTANAAYTSGLNKALNCAFSGGAVMGMCVVGLGLLGCSLIYIFTNDVEILTGSGEALIELAESSVSDLCIIPMQDFLCLGGQARINTPSTIGTNWWWRMKKNAFSDKLAARIYAMTKLYGRLETDED